MREVFKKALGDTKARHSWLENFGITLLALLFYWLFLSEDEAMEELTKGGLFALAAFIVWPIIEYIFNLACAPYRLLKEENQSLRNELSTIKSSGAREVITILGQEYEGTWYGNRLVLDESYILVSERYNRENFSINIDVPCPPNSLAEIGYNIEHCGNGDPVYMIGNEARIAIARPGSTRAPALTGNGRESVQVRENCALEVLVENNTGLDIILTIELVGWELHGRR